MRQGCFFNRTTGEWQKRSVAATLSKEQQGVEVINGVWTDRPIVQVDRGDVWRTSRSRAFFDYVSDKWEMLPGSEPVKIEADQGMYFDQSTNKWISRS